MTNYDAIVIGAGLAGLTATAQLARSGNRVLLLERNADLGGRARTDDFEGARFNQGGHALYRNAIGHQILQSLGVEPDGVAPPLDGAQLLIGGTTRALPLGPASLMRTSALGARDKVQFGKVLGTLGRLKPSDYANVSVDEWLAPYRPAVREVVKAIVRLSTYSAATNVMSADAAILQMQGGDEGVLYLHDGWSVLCADLAARATEAGAVISSGTTVRAIEPDGGGYVVTADGERFEATTVIVAAGGASLTARMLGVDEAVLGVAGPAPEAAVLDIVLDEMPANHRFVLGVDDPTYFSVHGPPARVSNDGRVAAVAMRYIGPDDDGDAEDHRASLQRIAAAAGVSTPIGERFLRRMTVTNGLPLASQGGMAARPAVAVADMSGAFIAGDWVGPRGLLADAAIASGQDAAVAAARTIGALARAH